MRELARITLLVINILLFASALIIITFIQICEFIGYDKGNNFLKKIRFPLNDNALIWVGFICVALSIILYFLRKKWFLA